jgi:hypothetical protein
MVRPERFELPTYCSGGNRSIHLSYGRPSPSVYMGGLRGINVSPSPRFEIGSQRRRPEPTAQSWFALNCQPAAVRARTGSVRSGLTGPHLRPSEPLVAASSAPAAAPAATIPTAISTSASAVAAATTAVLGFGTRFVHIECAPAHLRTVQCSNGFLSIFVTGHLHKAESARTSGVAVRHNAHPVHLSERFKHLPQFIFRRVKAQVPHKNILHASASALSCRSASSMRRTGRSETPS